MNPQTNPEGPREINISTNSNSPKPLTFKPKKILIKGKERKIFDSLDIPLPTGVKSKFEKNIYLLIYLCKQYDSISFIL